jgi:hypothetical protein
MAELKARFIMNEVGKPKYISSDNVRHYAIELFVEGAPKDAIGVTYQLHETYFDPLREAHDASHDFLVEITSYGDYDIVATLRTKPYSTRIKNSLYDALKGTYGETTDQYILMALNDIRKG